MKALAIFRKTLREARRDRLILILTLAFAPFFVCLEWLAFPAMTPSYRVALVDDDRGVVFADGRRLDAGRQLAEAIRELRDGSGRSILQISEVPDKAQGLAQLGRREATALVVLPANFSQALAEACLEGGVGAVRSTMNAGAGVAATSGGGATITMVGDLTSPTYAVAAVMTGAALDATVQLATGHPSPVSVVEEPLGGSASRTDFEMYVPGILVFAVILLVFQAAMAVARDAEAGALRRLQLTRMTSLDYLVGTSAVLVLIALAGVALTFVTALMLGFRSEGPLWAAFLVTGVTAVSVIGVGLMVAAFSRTVAQAFVIANFPLGLLMFFSGAMFPMPKVGLFTLAGHAIGPFDILPPTHAVAALNKIFTLGAGLGDVAFELGAVVLLSAVYFGIGVLLLRRAELRRG
jgi:ABC-2 type transport system permease protein